MSSLGNMDLQNFGESRVPVGLDLFNAIKGGSFLDGGVYITKEPEHSRVPNGFNST